MDTSKLKPFAQEARRTLMAQVSARMDQVLADQSAARREQPKAMAALEKEIAASDRNQVVEKVAYTWFNRFTALRFMDVNDYTRIRAVSPADGQTRPELLAEAAAGNIDPDAPADVQAKVAALLDGRTPSHDPQGEAYRLLLVSACNQWHEAMPFLFERIDHYTALLMPEDLLSADSLLAKTRAVMTGEACKDVEIIGWLYQFYISEKKDEVFAGLKKNKKITAENIPAATQLFTPHWIVRYLVENSLGRLWLLNRPASKLAAQMDYYIAPEEPETDFIQISKPEEIKICDPACGSGHMLTYAFDLLHAIYEEEGYEAIEIPGLILQHNLTGIEIDDRAGALAAFALAMKAAAKLGRRRFLRLEVKPNIVVLQDVSFTGAEMTDVAAVVGRDMFTNDLRETLGQFEQAKNFGSLIVPKLRDPAEALRVVAAKDFSSDLLLKEVQERVVLALCMAEALSSNYDVAVANPPYSGLKNLNSTIQNFAKSEFPDSKADLFSMFMERCLVFNKERGLSALINMQSWMFLGAFEKLRNKVLLNSTIINMAHIGERGFDSIGGAVVSTTAFILKNKFCDGYKGVFLRLVDGNSESEKELMLRNAIGGSRPEYVFHTSNDRFCQIPGYPIAYWMTDRAYLAFANGTALSKFSKGSTGLQTSDSDRFLRLAQEVNASSVGQRWLPFAKGGGFRRWFGNVEHLVKWENNGSEIKSYVSEKYSYLNGNYALVVKNEATYFSRGLLTSRVTTGSLSFRAKGPEEIYADACTAIFPEEANWFLALLNSKVLTLVRSLNPTMNFQASDIERFPVLEVSDVRVEQNAIRAIELSRLDWDAYETSRDFTNLPLLSLYHQAKTLAATYAHLRAHWQNMTGETKLLEEENNRIFINAYGLQDELKSEVPLEEITLTCNPAYRYGAKVTPEDQEARLLADTMREFISYAIGCMFGRYSLDAPGLILANQGETLQYYLTKVPNPSFEPDADNVIPVLDGDWFADDLTERFRKFLRVTFGEEHFAENLAFVEKALGKDLRRYLTRDFFDDHVKRYKKRPIYWMFASPKGSFQALIYMHRYRPDTVSIVLNDYLRAYRNKLEAHRKSLEAQTISMDATPAQRTKAEKEIGDVTKVITELDVYERDVLFPLATQKIEIDLDDGVKANYPKFGAALKPIKGLSDADD
ncbi:MAG: SAM-dependent methyltransferase [Sphingomonadales bacterium 28-64-96]|nr:MAG: SAM-dependent methyltransferase [Sphingomonadales bacterium 28-64-96]